MPTLLNQAAGRERKRVLVVEGECLTTRQLADQLDKLGYAVVGPALDLEEAHRLASGAELDAAVIDVTLEAEHVGLLAGILLQRNVPYLVVRDLPRPIEHFCEDVGFLYSPRRSNDLQEAIECMMMQRKNASARLPMRTVSWQ